jgi:hypothetical protein
MTMSMDPSALSARLAPVYQPSPVLGRRSLDRQRSMSPRSMRKYNSTARLDLGEGLKQKNIFNAATNIPAIFPRWRKNRPNCREVVNFATAIFCFLQFFPFCNLFRLIVVFVKFFWSVSKWFCDQKNLLFVFFAYKIVQYFCKFFALFITFFT